MTNVQRFWVDREATVSLTPDGFFEDPTTEWGPYVQPTVHPLAHFSDTPVLILLGDPGMGKSSELRQAYEEE